jgi:hypothetical protein
MRHVNSKSFKSLSVEFVNAVPTFSNEHYVPFLSLTSSLPFFLSFSACMNHTADVESFFICFARRISLRHEVDCDS